ncbi:MAG: hypothetical protein HOO89_05630 [Ferruginibacter sp.]|nr:hypothetical protein [Ferruginibacter sp.]
MKQTLRILFLTTLLLGQIFASYADRGIGKKKAKLVLNIKMNKSFNSSLNFNLRNGLTYTGSLLNTNTNTKAPSFPNTLITYQKGNSIYIVPVKQKVLIADLKKGYAGAKLVIKIR